MDFLCPPSLSPRWLPLPSLARNPQSRLWAPAIQAETSDGRGRDTVGGGAGSGSLRWLFAPLGKNFLKLAERLGAARVHQRPRQEAHGAACEAVTDAADTRPSSRERIQMYLVPGPLDVVREGESRRIVDS